MFSLPSVLVGIGFALLKVKNKELAMMAGIEQILAGATYFLFGVFGIFAGAIAIVLQVTYLIYFEKYLKQDKLKTATVTAD